MVDSTQIRGPFGSERLPVPNILEGEGQPAPAVQQDGPRVPINDAVLSDQPGFREARAARDARAQREDASVLETIGAAISTWDTTRLIQRLGRPSFDEDRTGFNIHEALQQVPMVLSEDELEYMTSVGKGPQSFQYALDQVKNLRQAQEVVGDSPVVGTLTMFADPLWLAIPPAVRLGKVSAVAGRAVSGAAGGAIAGGVTAFKEGPVADEDIALSMVLGSAAGVAFYKGGKLTKKHPDFPEDKAVEAVQDIQTAKATAQAKPRYKLVSPEVWEEIQIPPKEATFKWVPEEGAKLDAHEGHTPLQGVPVTYGGRHPKYQSEVLGPALAAVESGNYVRGVTKGGEEVRLVVMESEDGAEAMVVAFDKSNKKVGGLTYSKIEEDGVRQNPDVRVDEAHRRKGIASMMYDLAEAKGGLIPDVDAPGQLRSDLGEAFRRGRAAKATAQAKPRYKLVSPEVWEEIQIPPKEATFKWVAEPTPKTKLPPGLNGKVHHGVYPVKFKNPLDRVAYELTSHPRGDYAAAAKRKARNDELTAWAKSAGVSVEELVARGQAIRAELAQGGKTTRVVGGAKVVAKGELRVIEDTFFKTNPTAPQKPRMRRVLDQPAEPARTERRKVKDAVWEEVPQELSPAVAPNVDAKTIVQATEKALTQESKARGLGSKLMWNMHKTMESFGPVGKKVADLLYDNNSDLAKNSLESHREAILSDLRRHQFEYEDLMRQTMAARGYGTWKMVNPFTSREAYAAQRQIELDVQRELFRREQAARLGRPLKDAGVPKEIAEMADKIDALHKRALKEMQAAGVEGAENLLERPGYLNRRWSSASMEDIVTRLEGKGIPREQTLTKLNDMVSLSLRRANPRMDDKIAKQIGSAIIDRAMRKGVFEDSVFNAPGSPSVMAEMRDILKSSGLSHDDIERALDVLRVSTDEAGKQSFMKHRLDLDYRAQVRIGDETISVMDLIDSRVSSILDQYTKRVATTTAFARMGLVRPSDIENLRTELMNSIPVGKREEAKELFDNTIAHFRGDPAGAKVNDKFRLYQAYGRAISLAWSGLWQVTEYANAAAEFGLRKTLKYAAQEIPGFKGIMNPDKATARSLQNVLADHSVQSLRLRPFIARFEDGYDMDMGSAMQLSSQPMGALVPYANAMRYVHHHQAKLVGNLILDRVDQAARGNKEAAENLRKYGLESHVMDKLSQEIKKHGFAVDSWDDEVWAAARPAFAKMMDASVLKSRLGDIPAFAAFDQVGKLLFTYRTFVMTAHNKVLAGGLERNGAAALGLVLMYQLPLTLAAVNAQAVVRGEGLLSEEDMVKRALGQMGALGLFSEPLKWVTGESNSVGATYLIPADRGVQLFQSAVNADANRAASTIMSLLPVLSTSPFFRGMADQIKE